MKITGVVEVRCACAFLCDGQKSRVNQGAFRQGHCYAAKIKSAGSVTAPVARRWSDVLFF